MPIYNNVTITNVHVLMIKNSSYYDHCCILGQLYRVFDRLPIIPILLKDVMCYGNESSLLQCLHKDKKDNNDNCEVIVLECTGKRNTQLNNVFSQTCVAYNCV